MGAAPVSIGRRPGSACIRPGRRWPPPPPWR